MPGTSHTPANEPVLHTIVIGDDPPSWAAAGFALSGDNEVILGPVRIKLVGGEPRGVLAWEFSGLDSDREIDGLVSLATDAHNQPAANHPNGVTSIDHIVIMSPDVERTVTALESSGFKPRKRRVVETATPPRQQVFFWTGDTIIELVGPLEATSTGPSSIWGLAVVTSDIDASTATLGEFASAAKDAVQPGRRIATVRTKALDVSITIALMTPHV